MGGENQEVLSPSAGWGGHREGAGRPQGARDGGERLTGKVLMDRLQRLEKIGALGRTSRKVMHALGDAAYWLEVIGRLEKDSEWTAIVDVLKFHQQMDEGRPAQQINVTSLTVSATAEEIARARAVVRELVALPAPAQPVGQGGQPNTSHSLSIAQAVAQPTPSVPDRVVGMVGVGAGVADSGAVSSEENAIMATQDVRSLVSVAQGRSESEGSGEQRAKPNAGNEEGVKTVR